MLFITIASFVKTNLEINEEKYQKGLSDTQNTYILEVK